MKTLKIEIPDGFVVQSFDQETGELKFMPTVEKKSKDPFQIKTVADVLDDHGFTQDGFDQFCEDLEEDEKAYRILKLLAQSLNQGWTPDWDNSSQYKYFPWFYMEGGSSGFRFYGCDYWGTSSGVGSRLCFKSRELAEHAGKHFTQVYKQFMIIP